MIHNMQNKQEKKRNYLLSYIQAEHNRYGTARDRRGSGLFIAGTG